MTNVDNFADAQPIEEEEPGEKVDGADGDVDDEGIGGGHAEFDAQVKPAPLDPASKNKTIMNLPAILSSGIGAEHVLWAGAEPTIIKAGTTNTTRRRS